MESPKNVCCLQWVIISTKVITSNCPVWVIYFIIQASPDKYMTISLLLPPYWGLCLGVGVREEGAELARSIKTGEGGLASSKEREAGGRPVGVEGDVSVLKGFQLLLALALLRGAMGQVDVVGSGRPGPLKSTHHASEGGEASSRGGVGGGLDSMVRPRASKAVPTTSRARHLSSCAGVEAGAHLDHLDGDLQEGQEASRPAQKEQQACPLGQTWGYLRPTIWAVQTEHSSSWTRRLDRVSSFSILLSWCDLGFGLNLRLDLFEI